jgi:hypothetical protein
VPDHARASIDGQLPADRADVFRAHDLPEAIEALTLTDWWSLPEIEESPGIRRFTVDAAAPSPATTFWSASTRGLTIPKPWWFTSSISGRTDGRTDPE